MIFMFLEPAAWVICYTYLLKKPIGVTHQAEPRVVSGAKSMLRAVKGTHAHQWLDWQPLLSICDRGSRTSTASSYCCRP